MRALSTFLVTLALAGGSYGVAKVVSRPRSNVTRATLPAPKPRASAVSPRLDEPWTGVLVTQSVDLVARIDNTKVRRLDVRVGDSVRAGDVLGELDTTAFQHEVLGAEAALRASQAEAWNASVSVAQARDREVRRARILRVGDADVSLVSQEEIAGSKFDRLAASSRATAASATAHERQARLAYLTTMVAEATLRAPFDGVVAARYAEVGAPVREGRPVLRIVGRGRMRVRFAVPETEATGVSLQSRVSIAWDGRSLEGTVERIAPEIESASSCLIVEAVLDSEPTNSANFTKISEGSTTSPLAGRVVSVRKARPHTGG